MRIKAVLFSIIIFLGVGICASGIGLCNSAESYKHVIVTSKVLKEETGAYSLSKLKEHRIKQGLTSTIVAIEDILLNYEGRDDAEKLRNFIIDAKQNWETEYVLLAGDTNILPYRTFFEMNVPIASDMYFGCLEGDFDANKNGVWGEANDDLDFTFEVYVGRASAENSIEMSNFVYKTIIYENSPANASYHTKALQYNADDAGIGITQKWPDEYRVLDNKITMEYHFIPSATSDPVILPRLSSGNIGYYLGASHGTVTTLGNINIANAENLKNQDKYFFVASIACLPGRFEKDCLAEALTTSTRTGGAFAGFFNSQDAYGKVAQYLAKLRDSYLRDGVTRLGPLRAAIANRFNATEYATHNDYRYLAYEFNLFGDPATVWKMRDAEAIDLSFKFEEDNLNNCEDLSGNGNIITLKGGINNVNSDYGKALQFDAKGKYIAVASNKWTPLGDQKEFTLMMHLKPSEMREGDLILSKGKITAPFRVSLTGNGKVKVKINSNSPVNGIGNGEYLSAQQLMPNKWNHLAVRVDYKTGNISFFINGLKGNETALPAGYNIGINSEPLYIGSDSDNSDSGFRGLIDDLIIYSRSLSDKEISKFATWIDYSKIPSAPLVAATLSGLTDIQIEWQDSSSRVHNFILEYSSDSMNWSELGKYNYNQFSFLHTGLEYEKDFFYRIKASNNIGESEYSFTTKVTTSKMPQTDVPQPWTVRSIGTQLLEHYIFYRNDSVFFKAAEKDIWGNGDSFNFMYMPISGDAEISAKVINLDGDDAARMGGVMMRESLETDSKHASLLVIFSKGTIFRHRDLTGGTSSQLWNNGGGRTAPYWVKMVRDGDWFRGYYSSDGATWTKQEEYEIAMSKNIFIGLAATSHSETSSMDAVFTGLKVKANNVSVDKTELDMGILIFPNPARDIINVQLKNSSNAKFEMRNLNGQVVKFGKFTNANSEKIYLTGLNPGIYFLRIKTETDNINKQVIISGI